MGHKEQRLVLGVKHLWLIILDLNGLMISRLLTKLTIVALNKLEKGILTGQGFQVILIYELNELAIY
jgi:hypothetical protein